MLTVLFGKNGHIGNALLKSSKNVIALGRNEGPFEKPKKLLYLLDDIKPDLVVNAAAYTNVDEAENESELAFQINAETPGLLAEWCQKNSAVFVHYSTDHVYSGSTSRA